jgi:hypothetical protein
VVVRIDAVAVVGIEDACSAAACATSAVPVELSGLCMVLVVVGVSGPPSVDGDVGEVGEAASARTTGCSRAGEEVEGTASSNRGFFAGGAPSCTAGGSAPASSLFVPLKGNDVVVGAVGAGAACATGTVVSAVAASIGAIAAAAATAGAAAAGFTIVDSILWWNQS